MCIRDSLVPLTPLSSLSLLAKLPYLWHFSLQANVLGPAEQPSLGVLAKLSYLLNFSLQANVPGRAEQPSLSVLAKLPYLQNFSLQANLPGPPEEPQRHNLEVQCSFKKDVIAYRVGKPGHRTGLDLLVQVVVQFYF